MIGQKGKKNVFAVRWTKGCIDRCCTGLIKGHAQKDFLRSILAEGLFPL